MKNDPTAWRTRAPTAASHMHPTYPRDGRDTVYPPYEAIAATNTVGSYTRALTRVAARDPSLPHDYDAYLAQRVPSGHKMSELPPETGIDDRGCITDA